MLRGAGAPGVGSGKAAVSMKEDGRPAPDLSRCFGRYRAQTPQYALTHCVECPKLKSCVRTVWGREGPRQTARRDWWWERSPRALARARTAATQRGDFLAT